MFLLLVPSIYGISQLAELRRIAVEQRARGAAAFLALGRLQTALARLDRFQRSYVAAPAPELRAGMRQSLEDARLQLSRLATLGHGEVADVAGARLDALDDATRRIEELVESGQTDRATAYFEQVKPLLAQANESLDPIATAVDRRSIAGIEMAQQVSATTTTTMVIGLLVSLGLALALALWTTGAVTSPLRRLRAAMATVAGGEFIASPDLPFGRPDEIGDLSRSFRSMTRRLAELDRVRSEFMGVATHDLKAPVNVISGYAALIQEGIYGELSEKQREALESIQEQTRVLTGLANQLLDVSRLETGTFDVDIREFESAGFFAAVERAFRALAEQKRIDFRVEVDPSLPPTMLGDPDRLRDQVLGNLLSNAFKFTPEEGRIRLHVRRDDGHVRIEVADTGAGIPRDQLPYIFEKYYQAGAQARGMGTGLGLTIARQVVEAHHGRIIAESEPGKGTTFRITLPFRDGLSAAA